MKTDEPMGEIRKVPASTGAQWLIDGFVLLKASPSGLGAMGLVYGVIAAIVVAMSILAPEIGLGLQTLMIVAAPVLTGALVWAAREVAQGRQVGVASFAEPVRQGRVGALLVTLLPQIVLGLLMAVLLVVLVGRENVQLIASVLEKAQTAQPGAPLDPALIAALPAGRMLLWLLCVVVLAVLMFLMMFVAIPGVMLGGLTGFAALRASLRAGLRNLPAVLVFLGVLIVTMIGISLLAGIFGGIIRAIAGQGAQLVVVQLLFASIMTTIACGAVMSAWQSMLGGEAVPPPMPPGQLQA